jgi:GxxExxY protein
MNLELNLLSSKVIEAAIKVTANWALDFGSVYSTCMLVELREMKLDVESEVPLPVFYRGKKLSKMASDWTC